MSNVRKYALAAATIFALSFATISPSYAAFDAFIKFSADDGEVLNRAADPSQGINLGAPATDLRDMLDSRLSELTFRRAVDRASPLLAQWAENGERLGAVNIYVPDGRDGYFTYELRDVRVTGYTAASDAGERSTEEVVLNYGSISLVTGPRSTR